MHTNVAPAAKDAKKLVAMPVHERRANVRYLFTAAADVVDLETNARLNGRTSDLARGGCYIDTISTFPIGTNVSLRLTSEDRSFESRARVVYETPGVGMGLAFMSVEPDQLWVLEKWLGKLSGQLPPEFHDEEPMAVVSRGPEPEPTANAEPSFVLNELIIALMRKRVLSESEGKQLLQKLMR
jgi:hypothetical protein